MTSLRHAQKRLEALSKRAPQAVPGSATVERGGLKRIAGLALKPCEIIVRVMFGALEGGSKVRKAKRMAAQLPDSSAATQELVFRFAFELE